MKIPPIIKYTVLFGLSLGIPAQGFSPDLKNKTGYTLSELTGMDMKREREKQKQFMINELKKPVSKFHIPVDTGQVSCLYGYRRKANGDLGFHNGIDIGILGNASPKFAGLPDVLAAAPGIVSFVGREGGYGKVVKIKHVDSLETLYGHLNSFSVEEGDSVLPGQIVGIMGKTGKTRSKDKKGTGIHLHFEARRNGKHFDPSGDFIGYKKFVIDDTLYSSIVSLPVIKPYTDSKKINMEDVQKLKNNIQKLYPYLDIVIKEDSTSKEINPPLCNNPEHIHKKDLSSLTLPDLDSSVVDSYYGVQILSKLLPLSQKEIKELEELYGYSVKEGKEMVYKNGENKMHYKYSIRNDLRSLEEAVKFIDNFGIRGKRGERPGIIRYKGDKIDKTEWHYKSKFLNFPKL